MTRRPRTSPYTRGAAAVALWVLAIVVATAVAWWAVAFVGGSRAGSAGDVLSRHEVVTALEQHRAAATSTPTPSTTPVATSEPTPTVPVATPTPTVPTPTVPVVTPPPSVPVSEPAPQDVVRTWDVDGGQVSASCRGSAIGLVYTTASDGWTLETKNAGPEEIEVKLSRGEDETTVRAVCVAGVPNETGDDERDAGDDG